MAELRYPVPEGASQRWTEVAWGARVAHRLLEITGDPAPTAPVSADDAAYPVERLSAWVKSYLRAGAEHLLLWADHVAPLKFAEGAEVVMWPRPFYTLARCALESGSQAAWVMEPVESEDRVERHLRLLAYDLNELATASSVTGDATAAVAARARITKISTHIGREPAKAPAYVDLVKIAARWAEQDVGVAEYTWRLASAATHGRNWFMGATHTAVPGEEYTPGYYRATYVPDAEQVADVLKLAEAVLTRATFRYLMGCGYDLARCLEVAMEQLAEEAPLLPGVDRELFIARSQKLRAQALAETQRDPEPRDEVESPRG